MRFVDAAGVSLRRRFQKPINTAEVLIVSTYTTLWGLFVMLPFFEVFDQAPIFRILTEIAPEWLWGIVTMLTGLYMIWGVAKPSVTSLIRAGYAGAIHWLVIASCFFIGDWQNTGWLTSLFIAIYCAFIYLNVRVNRNNLPFENNADNINPR